MNIFEGEDYLEENARNMTSCEFVMEHYLLNQYVVYRYRMIIAFIIAALAMPYLLRAFGVKNGDHSGTYFFLFFVYFVIQWAISYIIKLIVPNDALYKLLIRCRGWQDSDANKSSCKSVIDADAAAVYLKEGFVAHGEREEFSDDMEHLTQKTLLEGDEEDWGPTVMSSSLELDGLPLPANSSGNALSVAGGEPIALEKFTDVARVNKLMFAN